jgi:hypothetical protein
LPQQALVLENHIFFKDVLEHERLMVAAGAVFKIIFADELKAGGASGIF